MPNPPSSSHSPAGPHSRRENMTTALLDLWHIIFAEAAGDKGDIQLYCLACIAYTCLCSCMSNRTVPSNCVCVCLMQQDILVKKILKSTTFSAPFPQNESAAWVLSPFKRTNCMRNKSTYDLKEIRQNNDMKQYSELTHMLKHLHIHSFALFFWTFQFRSPMFSWCDILVRQEYGILLCFIAFPQS